MHPIKIRKLIELLESDGWRIDRQKGSHRQFKHPGKPGVVTIAGKDDEEIQRGTLNSVLKQAKIKDEGV
jgi:predicted RNA binding protein YcfA (HicA-like mRNA interferase family)